MINGSTSVWLGITFVLVGALNVWLVLQASATLLYCVRTSSDIMFESELQQFRSRQMLQYHVVLSEPNDDRPGGGAGTHHAGEFR